MWQVKFSLHLLGQQHQSRRLYETQQTDEEGELFAEDCGLEA